MLVLQGWEAISVLWGRESNIVTPKFFLSPLKIGSRKEQQGVLRRGKSQDSPR